MKTRYKTVYYI